MHISRGDPGTPTKFKRMPVKMTVDRSRAMKAHQVGAVAGGRVSGSFVSSTSSSLSSSLGRAALQTLTGSNCSQSSSDTRTSRFNNRPIYGSPMVAARDCFERAGGSRSVSGNGSEGTAETSVRDDLEAKAEAVAAMFGTGSAQDPTGSVGTRDDGPSDSNGNGNGNGDDKNDNGNGNHRKGSAMKRLQASATSRIESAKDILERRLKKIDSQFFRENPTHKVPRFVPNGAWLCISKILGLICVSMRLPFSDFGCVRFFTRKVLSCSTNTLTSFQTLLFRAARLRKHQLLPRVT